ncbi:hypothetical protein KPH14_000720 [Odynerus spinipes]|uniref:Integrase catalytic domain-containing protein n=1 Tax=Odynerus spinipes TaxID=1348599 RepID=A0AAD9RDG0_9HYME|nr:hypothetical protein KPH14_000720 [Odynerus spinipes]
MKADPVPLPIHRVKNPAVLKVTGADFTGSIFLRGQRKGWICLYTCAVYRAGHLKLLTLMSTKTFLDSLRRFIGRRSRPSIIFSDNGTNFISADNAFEKLNWDVISKYSSAERIDW